MPIEGIVRNRFHQFGKQTVLNTPVAATRRVAWRGVPDINPNWTEQDEADTGMIDSALPRFRVGSDITMPLSGPATFQDLPLVYAAGVRGGVTPTGAGTAKTWVFTAQSDVAMAPDYFTDQFSDDVSRDGMQLYGGIVESFEMGYDETQGPWTISTDWRFSGVNAHVTPTSGLMIGSNLPLMFGADTSHYIDDTSGGIGGTILTDTVHSFTFRVENEIDVKRFSNGSNTRFQVNGYGVVSRTITATWRFAKTNAIINAINSETADWLSADPVNRYMSVVTQSTALAQAATPYSQTLNFSGNWFTRADTEIGGNSVVDLVCMGRYDLGLGYPFRATVVNTLATLP